MGVLIFQRNRPKIYMSRYTNDFQLSAIKMNIRKKIRKEIQKKNPGKVPNRKQKIMQKYRNKTTVER